MQYVLSESELKGLAPTAELDKLRRSIHWLRKQFVPRCIYAEATQQDKYCYCSDCPLGRRDKRGPPKELMDAVCAHQKSYPK